MDARNAGDFSPAARPAAIDGPSCRQQHLPPAAGLTTLLSSWGESDRLRMTATVGGSQTVARPRPFVAAAVAEAAAASIVQRDAYPYATHSQAPCSSMLGATCPSSPSGVLVAARPNNAEPCRAATPAAGISIVDGCTLSGNARTLTMVGGGTGGSSSSNGDFFDGFGGLSQLSMLQQQQLLTTLRQPLSPYQLQPLLLHRFPWSLAGPATPDCGGWAAATAQRQQWPQQPPLSACTAFAPTVGISNVPLRHSVGVGGCGDGRGKRAQSTPSGSIVGGRSVGGAAVATAGPTTQSDSSRNMSTPVQWWQQHQQHVAATPEGSPERCTFALSTSSIEGGQVCCDTAFRQAVATATSCAARPAVSRTAAVSDGGGCCSSSATLPSPAETSSRGGRSSRLSSPLSTVDLETSGCSSSSAKTCATELGVTPPAAAGSMPSTESNHGRPDLLVGRQSTPRGDSRGSSSSSSHTDEANTASPASRSWRRVYSSSRPKPGGAAVSGKRHSDPAKVKKSFAGKASRLWTENQDYYVANGVPCCKYLSNLLDLNITDEELASSRIPYSRRRKSGKASALPRQGASATVDDCDTDDSESLDDPTEEDLAAHTKAQKPPPCDCGAGPYDEAVEGPYYTQIGTAATIEGVRLIMEKRTGEVGDAIRIEKVRYTGKEGATLLGCPAAKWVIRQTNDHEKFLICVRHRRGHTCITAYLIVAVVHWNALTIEAADHIYEYLVRTLPVYGFETERRCGTNEPRSCACQGWDVNRRGASFSFGCSWSVYYDGCKFARSSPARKFRLRDDSLEKVVESKLQVLTQHIGPMFQKLAPVAYENQVRFEKVAKDCRLGFRPGRPFSGVTATVDFCAHAHYDTHNMNNGCTVVTTLTKHRGEGEPEDEQLHVLPMYVLDGTEAEIEKKIQSGAIEVLNKGERQLRQRSVPLQKKKKGTERFQSPKVKEAMLKGLLEASESQGHATAAAGDRNCISQPGAVRSPSFVGDDASADAATTRGQPASSSSSHGDEPPVPHLPPVPRPPSPELDDPQPQVVTETGEYLFEDPMLGGVAIALKHGSVLYEVAERELHATTALRKPDRYDPTRISLVFYQHKKLNFRKHGHSKYVSATQRRARERDEAQRMGKAYVPKSQKYKQRRQQLQEEANGSGAVRKRKAAVSTGPPGKKVTILRAADNTGLSATVKPLAVAPVEMPSTTVLPSVVLPQLMLPQGVCRPKIVLPEVMLSQVVQLQAKKSLLLAELPPAKLPPAELPPAELPPAELPLANKLFTRTTSTPSVKFVQPECMVTGPYHRWISM